MTRMKQRFSQKNKNKNKNSNSEAMGYLFSKSNEFLSFLSNIKHQICHHSPT